MSQKIGARIYADGIAHTFSLPYRVFEDRQSGALLDKLQKARNDLQKFLSSLINTVFLSLIGMIIVIIYAFYVHRGVGVAYLIMLPILAFTTLQISNRIRSAQQHIVTTSAELAGATTENIRNVTLIKSL
jgi:ATP-binding cassette subfamily B protein